MMTNQHANTFGNWPKTKAEVRALDTHHLVEFMNECGVEPADFENCLACYAYLIAQKREDEKAKTVKWSKSLVQTGARTYAKRWVAVPDDWPVGREVRIVVTLEPEEDDEPWTFEGIDV